MYGFDVIWRGTVTTLEESQLEEVRLGKLKNGNATGKDEITGEMIKGGGDRVVDWILRLCTRVKVRGWNVRTIEVLASLSVVGKIYAGILENRVHRVT